VPSDLLLVVGLGNPGPGYAGNRHNVGQMVVDELARRIGVTFKASARTNSRVAEGRIAVPGPRVVLAKPNSFMNVSGGPVAALAKYYAVEPDRIVVVHDELDIPFDTVRLKLGGGPGGHNGVKDVAKALGTPDFIRVRVGIGRPPGRMDPADFVLRDFAGPEREAVASLIGEAADAVEVIVRDGLTAAQQVVHAPKG
jgi:PTH1 family peptidyl-tRNA hydrolase